MKNTTRKRPSVQLCWFCQKATNNGCSWSKSFEPVDGWTANKSVWVDSCSIGRVLTETYEIISCPEFVPDANRKE